MTSVWALALTLAGMAQASETVVLPQGSSVHDVLYSQTHGRVVLRLDDRLMTYDPQRAQLETIRLPESTLSFAELEGEVVVGTENGIYRIDVRRGIVTGRLDSPVPVRSVALGHDHVWVVQNDGERQGVWWLPLSREGKVGFATLPIENRGVLHQGEAGPVLFDRWLSSVGLLRMGLDDSGRFVILGCPQFHRARSQTVWLAGRRVFLESGHKLTFGRQACPSGDVQELAYSTRLPVEHVDALCAGPNWIAVVERPSAVDSGRYLDVIADPLPKRLGTFPLPSLQDDGMESAWGRHVACDGSGGRVFVVLHDRWWKDGEGTWGLATFDIAPLQADIEKSEAWSELLH